MSELMPARPPSGSSIKEYYETEWSQILELWDRGFRSDIRILSLSEELESHRARIFDRREAGTDFDCEKDWLAAHVVHQNNMDYIANRETYRAYPLDAHTHYI